MNDFTENPAALDSREEDRERPARFADLALIVPALCLAIVLSLLLWSTPRGFGLTDETFYLIWTADPTPFPFMHQPFGHFLRPIFDLLQHSIISMRVLGVLLVAFSGCALGLSIGRYYGSTGLLKYGS